MFSSTDIRQFMKCRRYLTSAGVSLLVLAPSVGCHRRHYGSPLFRSSGFRYAAGSALVGQDSDTLRVAVVVVNESHEQRVLMVSTGCFPSRSPVIATLFGNGRNWNSEGYEKRQQPQYFDSAGRQIPTACAGNPIVMTFPPGASRTYELKVPTRAIFDASLPPGHYDVTAQLAINGTIVDGLNAGTIALSSPRT
jgi:hypothetical protein